MTALGLFILGVLVGIALGPLLPAGGRGRAPTAAPRPRALLPIAARPRPPGVRLVDERRPYDWAEAEEASACG